jgi:hypothetical protein
MLQTKVPITLNIRDARPCSELAATMGTFLDQKLSFAFDTISVSCQGGAPAARRLMQNSATLAADVAGPGAGRMIKEGLQPNSPIFADLSTAYGNSLQSADAENTDPPPPPPAPNSRGAYTRPSHCLRTWMIFYICMPVIVPLNAEIDAGTIYLERRDFMSTFNVSVHLSDVHVNRSFHQWYAWGQDGKWDTI